MVKVDGDLPLMRDRAAALCHALVSARASVILDISTIPITDRRAFVADFVMALVDLPRALWTPYLIVIDEAHNFAPEHELPCCLRFLHSSRSLFGGSTLFPRA